MTAQQVFVQAIHAKMVSDESTDLGYANGEAVRAAITTQWMSIKPAVGPALSLGTLDSGLSMTRLTCRLLALLDFLIALQGCQSIHDDVDRANCMLNAQGIYQQAITSCDAM